MTQNPLHQRGISIFHKAIKIYLVSHWERPTGGCIALHAMRISKPFC